ncbi:cobalamin-dependent protein [Candidatus Bathyarchaeota archaeon]|nr:cobalamin-dependent protein [Candidatus Bathyarchaeota archaeon]
MRCDVLDALRDALVEMDMVRVNDLVKEALSSGFDPMKIVEALRSGMDEVGRRFENGEYFISELVMSGEIMKRTLEILKPHLKAGSGSKGRIVLGTIIGDLHDIGKEIIKTLLISAGFEVYDLGVDVPPEKFVEKAKEIGAKIIGISALLSTSIVNTNEVIKKLREEELRDKVRVIVGGAAARPWMIEEYGLDAAVNDAVKGLEIVKRWMDEDEPTGEGS